MRKRTNTIDIEKFSQNTPSADHIAKERLSKYVVSRRPLGRLWFDVDVFRYQFGDDFRDGKISLQSLQYFNGRHLGKPIKWQSEDDPFRKSIKPIYFIEQVEEVIEDQAHFAAEPVLFSYSDLSLEEIPLENRRIIDPSRTDYRIVATCGQSVLANYPEVPFDLRQEREAIGLGLFKEAYYSLNGLETRLGRISVSADRKNEALQVIKDTTPEFLLAGPLRAVQLFN